MSTSVSKTASKIAKTLSDWAALNFLETRTAIAKRLPNVPKTSMMGIATPSIQNLTLAVWLSMSKGLEDKLTTVESVLLFNFSEL